MTMPNWVKERAACTLENNFLTIEKSIKSDIKVTAYAHGSGSINML